MSAGRVTCKARKAHKFIDAHGDEFSIQMTCRLLGVAGAGYYAWRELPVSDRAQEDARLFRLMRASFTASHGIYGALRVFLDLRGIGEACSKHSVGRLMRESGLRALHGYGAACSDCSRRYAITSPYWGWGRFWTKPRATPSCGRVVRPRPMMALPPRRLQNWWRAGSCRFPSACCSPCCAANWPKPAPLAAIFGSWRFGGRMG